MTEQVNQEESVITPEDLATALNGNFLEKMKEFAWRGKEARLPEVPNSEMHSFQVWVGFSFAADPDSSDPLTFDKIGGYRFQCSPFTKEDAKAALEAQQKDVWDENIQEESKDAS